MKKILVSLFLLIHFAAYSQVVGTPYFIIPFQPGSSNGTALVAGYTCSTASTGIMMAGVAVSGVTQTITANVTTAGTYSISTTANGSGVTFTGSGTFAGSGAQNIVLTASGTPTAAGNNSFTLNTTVNCSFSRATLEPLVGSITLSAISPYFIASVNDQDYLPYSAPTVAASLATAQAADGGNEALLDFQGSLTTTGVTLKIPYTVVTATVNLPAFSQTINVPASYTQDNIARDVTFSYAAASLPVGSGTIDVTLRAVGGTLNARKLDLQTGIGNDNLGWLLAKFSYSTNNSGGATTFDFRNIAAIPDREYADVNHRMFYMPVLGASGRIWLNNNLGANYANTSKTGIFNPSAQASSSTDFNANGSLFQWGRYADGHELINWTSGGSTAVNAATTGQSSSTSPGNSFLSGSDVWYTGSNTLWQGVSGGNNPCPVGYRLPTLAELNSERLAFASTDAAGAFASLLKLTMAGYRDRTAGGINGSVGYYYTSTEGGSTGGRYLYFSSTSNSAVMQNAVRGNGMSVRCIAAGDPSTDGTAVVSGYSCSTASAGTMTAGVAVSGVTQTITATVTTEGTYIISTTANGVTFTGSGTYAGTGAQNIVLTATGTPTALGIYSFALNTTPNCSFTRAATDPSTNGTAVVSAYTCTTASAGTMAAGVAVSGVTQTITANVTSVGTYSISTAANGVTFTGTGTFAGTGAQNIVLTASGTPTAAGSNSFTLNTTPNCSFSRTTAPTPLPVNITLSAITSYFIASVNDQDYLPYTAPTVAASLATAQAAGGGNETLLDIQGSLTTTGVTLKIPYTVVTATVNLPAISQTINVPASYTQDNIARDVTFSYAAASLGVGSGTINATLRAVGGTLNAKKLDLQTGIGNDNLGWLLAQFSYATNSSGGVSTFDFRNIAPIPDRNIADANHVMFYMPIIGGAGRMWLSNNLGADYANTTKGAFNPAAQASGATDFNAYGSLFQWGRYADGHELITWSSGSAGTAVNTTTSTLSSTDDPGNANFIIAPSTPFDWRSSKNDNLWQGLSGTNNPCPLGYRLPTDTELSEERQTWASANFAGAMGSPLKLSAGGRRGNADGGFLDTGTGGRYWAGTVVTEPRSFIFDNSGTLAGMTTNNRARGFAVRCIKD